MPPALLKRANSLKSEHDLLLAESVDTFSTKTSKRLGELKNVATVLPQWDKARNSLQELHALLQDPSLEEELRDLAEEDLESTQTELEKLTRALTLALVPKDPFAHLPCLMEIRPGAGGDEAALFASELLRMYKLYCVRRRFRVSMLKHETISLDTSGGEAPLAEAILEIETPGAYGEMRSETGVHRVQRVPATESKGRTHTSAASVVVLPSLPESSSEGQEVETADLTDPTSDYYVNSSDVRVDTMKSSGAGGQHVNTTDSAVRLTHVPTGIVVNMQDSRSQHQNRKKAWLVLRSRLAQAKRDVRDEENMQRRRSAGAQNMGRENKVRTYNFGQQRVTDHRSGLSVHNLDDVMVAGESLDKVMESVKGWLVDQDVQALTLEDETHRKGKR